MPLMILGLVFVIGLFAYYMFTTSGSSGRSKDVPPASPSPLVKTKPRPRKQDAPKDTREEDNVIYLTDDIDQMKKNRRIDR